MRQYLNRLQSFILNDSKKKKNSLTIFVFVGGLIIEKATRIISDRDYFYYIHIYTPRSIRNCKNVTANVLLPSSSRLAPTTSACFSIHTHAGTHARHCAHITATAGSIPHLLTYFVVRICVYIYALSSHITSGPVHFCPRDP